MKTINEIKDNCNVEYSNMRLSPLKEDDIEHLRLWRNDTSQTKYLRKINYITKEAQLDWYKEYIKDDTQIVFSINETRDLNRIVGSVSLYNIDLDKKTAEVGKIQIGDPEAHGRGLGRASLVGAVKVAFQCLDIRIIEGAVHKDNISAHKNDMKIGFRIVGEKEAAIGGTEDLLEMTEEDAMSANDYYSQVKITFL